MLRNSWLVGFLFCLLNLPTLAMDTCVTEGEDPELRTIKKQITENFGKADIYPKGWKEKGLPEYFSETDHHVSSNEPSNFYKKAIIESLLRGESIKTLVFLHTSSEEIKYEIQVESPNGGYKGRKRITLIRAEWMDDAELGEGFTGAHD